MGASSVPFVLGMIELMLRTQKIMLQMEIWIHTSPEVIGKIKKKKWTGNKIP